MNSIRKALILGNVPEIFWRNFEIIFQSHNTYFISLEEQPSTDEFLTRVYCFCPDFVMITTENYLKNSEFYDDLMKSFPQCIFWKIDMSKVWRLEDIEKTLKNFKKELLKRR